jgi:hypothetical protein
MATELRTLADEYKALTGEDILCFVSQPRPGQSNYVFQEASFTTRASALEYLKVMLFKERLRRGLETVNPHDYEPGDIVGPMDTDPRCKICGEARHG